MIDDVEISRLRTEIDRIDRQLLALLEKRVRLVLEVGEQKRTRALEIYDPAREQALVERLVAASDAPLDAALVERVFREVIEQCRRLESAHVRGAAS